MKKIVLLMMLILMAIFIFSPQVQAREEPRIKISFEITPPAVQIGQEVNVSWEIERFPTPSADHYTFRIYYPNGTVAWGPLTFWVDPDKSRLWNNSIYRVPKDSPIGQYKAEIYHPGIKHPMYPGQIIHSISASASFPVIPQNGTLIIFKFFDYNQNKIWDKGEEGLDNWDFTITQDEKIIAEGRTNETGFCVLELPVGKYIITEHPKPCWRSTTPTSKETEVIADQTSEVKFGNYGFGTLLIHKFNDSNQNKVQDNGEEGLANWEFTIKHDGRKVDTCKTNETGFCVLELPEGKYSITEKLKKGWINTTPITQEKEVKICSTTKAEFGNSIPPPRLIISKFYDSDQNGIRDKGEWGIPVWAFEIKFPDGSIEIVTTGPDGRYMIRDPPTGPYTITEHPKTCWNNSTPTVRRIEIKPDQEAEVEFGNYEIGTLLIHKFNDTNHNGNWDAEELPLPNWGFRIKNSKGGGTGRRGFIDITKYTDDNGSISLELPANAGYDVTDTLLVGWNNSTPQVECVYIKPCEDTSVTFGNYKSSPIIIYKFNDTNENGIRDRGEKGIYNWTFTITGPNGAVYNRTTDEKGKIIIEDAIPGHYRIEDRIKDGWKATTTPIREVEVKEGKMIKVEFCNSPPIPPCDRIYVPLHKAPLWHNNNDENLNVSKYLDPHVVNCLNPDVGEIINVTLRVCVFPVMAPTDIMLAIDTSGSVVETGGGLLEIVRDGVIGFIEKNEARFGENVRIGLVNWDDDIDETVNLTTDYGKIKKACSNFSGNLQEFTLYQEGLNGSVEVFNRTPREDVKRIIVFITDAKGEYRNITRFPDAEEYTIHSITIGPTQNEEIANMLGNLTSQYGGENVSINESSYELEKELTNLTVSCIERRTLKNVTVVETLPNYMRALKDGYGIKPTSSEHINSDGMEWNTVTMKWDIGDLSSDECWENTFKAIFCCRVPADVTQPEGISGVTSEVTYSDPTNITITKHLLIPEGGIWIRPLPWWKMVPQWMWVILGAMLIAVITIATYCYVRIRRGEG